MGVWKERERGTDEEGEGRQRSRVFSSNPSPCGTQERTASSPKTFLISVLRRPCHFLGVFFGGRGVNLIKLKNHNYIDKILTNIHVAITQN